MADQHEIPRPRSYMIDKERDVEYGAGLGAKHEGIREPERRAQGMPKITVFAMAPSINMVFYLGST